MKYYMEFRYSGQIDPEPVIHLSLQSLITALLEWYGMIMYINTSFLCPSRIQQRISPNKLILEPNTELVVYNVNSRLLDEQIVVYMR